MKKINAASLPLLLLIFIFCKSSINESIQPEVQFVQIDYKYSFMNELNTFENTFQKDLVMDSVVKVPFWLTKDEQNKILEKVKEINFFELPVVFPRVSGVKVAPDPGEQILRIKYRNLDKTVRWFTYPEDENNSQLNSVKELAALIESIIQNKPEYKQLPETRGGRL